MNWSDETNQQNPCKLSSAYIAFPRTFVIILIFVTIKPEPMIGYGCVCRGDYATGHWDMGVFRWTGCCRTRYRPRWFSCVACMPRQIGRHPSRWRRLHHSSQTDQSVDCCSRAVRWVRAPVNEVAVADGAVTDHVLPSTTCDSFQRVLRRAVWSIWAAVTGRSTSGYLQQFQLPRETFPADRGTIRQTEVCTREIDPTRFHQQVTGWCAGGESQRVDGWSPTNQSNTTRPLLHNKPVSYMRDDECTSMSSVVWRFFGNNLLKSNTRSPTLSKLSAVAHFRGHFLVPRWQSSQACRQQKSTQWCSHNSHCTRLPCLQQEQQQRYDVFDILY